MILQDVLNAENIVILMFILTHEEGSSFTVTKCNETDGQRLDYQTGTGNVITLFRETVTECFATIIRMRMKENCRQWFEGPVSELETQIPDIRMQLHRLLVVD